MTETKKRYDGKFRVTRILLSDYLVLKELAQETGFSMAEALHELIKHKPQVSTPVTRVRATPVTTARATPVLVYRAKPALSVNGNKAVAFAIRPKGGKIQ
jgi:hypothetical protein